MKFSIREPAKPFETFAPEAFQNSIGNVIKFHTPDGTFESTLTSVEIVENGKAAILGFETHDVIRWAVP